MTIVLSDAYSLALPDKPEYVLVPELNSRIFQILKDTPMNNDHIRRPVPLSTSIWSIDGSVLDLLFNYNFNKDYYGFYYREVSNDKIRDPNLKNRVLLYAKNQMHVYHNDIENWYVPYDSTSSEFGVDTDIVPALDLDADESIPVLFKASSLTSDNIFGITFGEKDMLDILYLHKNENVVDISDINFEDLPSSLSKLIFAYLRLEIYQDYSYLSDITNISDSDSRFLVKMYEKYVLDHYYRRLSLAPCLPKTDFEPEFINSDSTSKTFVITETDIQNKVIEFNVPYIPFNEDALFVSYDSIKQVLNTDYEYILTNVDSTSAYSALSWNNKTLQSKLTAGDKLYVIWAYTTPKEEA